MKVKTLIGLLKNLNPDDEVIIALGENEGSRVVGVDAERYWQESKKTGQIGLRYLTLEDIDNGLTSEDIEEGGEDCVVLWSENAL